MLPTTSRLSLPCVARRARSTSGLASLAIVLACAWVGAGCKDQGKVSAQKAQENVTSLQKLVESDVGEIERGLPLGAKKLAPLFVKTPDLHQDPPAARSALIKTRREVPDLNLAKSTFFALTDAKGIAIRNDLEEDVMAGQNLVASFPDLAKAESGSYVVTTGAFPSTPKAGQKGGPDRDWIAAEPVQGDDGKVLGIYVTGWTYRRFALHLQESLKHDLGEALKKEGDTGKLPVFYVAVFDATGVYPVPSMPDVNLKALTDLDLEGKTSGGSAQGVVNITDRDFGYAAVRVPKLAEGAGIVVLRSEL